MHRATALPRLALPVLAALASACIPGNRPDEPLPAAPPAAPPAPAEPVVMPPSTPAVPKRPSIVATDAVEVAATSLIVRKGDTLRSIAERTGAGSEAIARANGLAAPFVIRPGQRLTIPGGRWHQVRAGQTGIAIARAYGVPWAGIVAANALEEPYILRTGQRLLLPTAREVAALSVEERASAFRLDIADLISGAEPAVAPRQAVAKPVRTSVATPAKPLPPTVAVVEPARFAGRFDWPLDGRILTSFGPLGSGRRSNGIDIAAERGAPVKAAADGVVAYVGTEIAAFGGLILIRHGDGYTTAYGNAEELLVTRGQSVTRGQVIARAGETGSATRPQLHFEIRQKRAPVDPLRLLRPRA